MVLCRFANRGCDHSIHAESGQFWKQILVRNESLMRFFTEINKRLISVVGCLCLTPMFGL